MKIPARIVLLLMLSASTVSAGEIFKCVAADGSITFSDTPCSHTNDDITVVNDLDSRVTTYGTEYSDGYGEPDFPRRYNQEDHTDSPYAQEIARTNSRQISTPNYIEIPPEPEKPEARNVPSQTHL